MNRYLETRPAPQERLANPVSMTSSAIRRQLIWRNWVRIRKTVRVTPDGRWPDRQALSMQDVIAVTGERGSRPRVA
jgi:hypothetical protein